MPQQIDNGISEKSWFVMCHLKPQQIETLLQMESDGKFLCEGEKPLPSFRFYVPFLYMPVVHSHSSDVTAMEAEHYAAQDDFNALRSDLRSFVFIQASPQRVHSIVQSDWNTRARLRLWYYRDTNQNVVRVSDAEVRLLMTAIQDHHLRFYLDQPLDDFAPGDRVILKKEPWNGRHGFIKDVALKRGQLCMTIAVNILGHTKSINFTDIRVGDIVFEDEERGRMFSSNPITNYEEEILDLLSHRFRRRRMDEVVEADQLRLRRLSTYNHIYVDDEAERARFASLKLICAYLMQNQKRKEAYFQEVNSMLGGRVIAETDADAYLMIALFITTRRAQWRDAVKSYRKSSPDSLPVLRRYHAIIKDIRARRTRKKE